MTISRSAHHDESRLATTSFVGNEDEQIWLVVINHIPEHDKDVIESFFPCNGAPMRSMNVGSHHSRSLVVHLSAQLGLFCA